MALAVGNQRLFISQDAQFPVDWDKVVTLHYAGQTLYWKRWEAKDDLQK